MLAKTVRRGVAVGAAGAGLILTMAGGTAGAANRVASTVLSDTIGFAGTLKPGPVVGTFIVTSVKCAIASDLETVAPCQLNGTITVPKTGNPTGSFTVVSNDGKTQGNFTLTPITGTASFKLKGAGTENDAPDPGGPPPSPYSAAMLGTLTPNFPAMTVKGKIKVFESSTAP